MKLLICLVMLVWNAAAVQDMTDKMFTFSWRSNDCFVKLRTAQTNFNAVTLCHRSFTDLQRSHSFFSLTTTDFNSFGFQTFYNHDTRQIGVWVKGVRADFGSFDYSPNKWHSICSTWDSSSGVVQLWVDGQPLSKKYTAEFPITGQTKIVLGQEQSKHDDLIGFISTMSFRGMMTDVHMWDYILSACEIHSYMAEQSFPPGNVVNWAALDFQTKGLRLIVDDKQTCQRSTL